MSSTPRASDIRRAGAPIPARSPGPFALLVAGSFVNALGTGMTAFVLGVHAYSLTGSATAVSLIQLSAFAPLVLLAPLTGVLADRFDRRLIMILGDGGSVVGLAVVCLAVARAGGIAWLCLGVLLSSCLASLTEPALRASVTDVVEPDDYVRASGALQLASAAKFLLAPVVAGFLLSVIGVTGVVLLDAATCLVTVVLTWRVRGLIGAAAVEADSAGLMDRLADGWRAVTATRSLRAVIALMILVTFAMGATQTLLKPILLPLGDARSVGTVETLAAVGLLAGSAAVSALAHWRPVSLLTLGLTGAGAAMTVLCLRPSPIWVAVVGVALFAALPAGNAGADALVRAQVPGGVQARAWGLISLITQSGYLVAFMVAGPAADRLLEPALADGGAWALGLGAVVGTGPGRGSAVVVSAVGLLVLAVAVVTHRARRLLEPPGADGDGTGGAGPER